MNLATALFIFYLGAYSSQPAKIEETEPVGRADRLPRTIRARSLVRYRYPTRLAPYVKRGYTLPERAEDIGVSELMKAVGDDEIRDRNPSDLELEDKHESVEEQSEDYEMTNSDDDDDRISPVKRSFFAFNDLPLQRRSIRWTPGRLDGVEQFLRIPKSRLMFRAPTRIRQGQNRRKIISQAGIRRQAIGSFSKPVKRSGQESNSDLDWSDYFGVDKRSVDYEDSGDVINDIAFRRKRMSGHIHMDPTEVTTKKSQ